MHRKILGLIAALAMAVSLVGVSWASTNDQPGDEDGTSTTEAETTSSTLGETATTIDDDDDTTSTTLDDDEADDATTSTTIDNKVVDDDEDEEEEFEEVIEDQRVEYDIPGVGSVTVEIVDGRLELVNVSAPGWDIRIKNAEADEIKVEFRSGSDEAEFEAELEDSKIKFEIERESS